MSFPIEELRRRFPALTRTDAGIERAYFDAPGGTQLCSDAIERIHQYMRDGVANAAGDFSTSAATDVISAAAHAAIADLLGGTSGEIAFGPNMTTLTLALSRALARDWSEGDELVVTRLDHDANVAPWLAVAQDRAMTVRWLDFDPATGQLDLDGLADLLSDRTRLVAVPAASNALGTVCDLARIVALTRAHSNALIHVDAVQLVPHASVDVTRIGCDFLTCSLYKLFGPHVGVLWGRAECLERLAAYKVRPASTRGAARFETGALSFEALAGVLGMADYLGWLGVVAGGDASCRRSRFRAAFDASADYEHELGERFLQGLSQIKGASLFGPPTMDSRVPTFAFTLRGCSPPSVAKALGARSIFVWAGNFYAVETIKRLGLADSGGLVRVGLCHYHTADEVDRLLTALQELA